MFSAAFAVACSEGKKLGTTNTLELTIIQSLDAQLLAAATQSRGKAQNVPSWRCKTQQEYLATSADEA
ncbi:MAG: hypothetical protein PW735_07510 [Acidobacteriaceae bacterium]|nr:hypothetical protein [Acidobacteriaceae bacterium]